MASGSPSPSFLSQSHLPSTHTTMSHENHVTCKYRKNCFHYSFTKTFHFCISGVFFFRNWHVSIRCIFTIIHCFNWCNFKVNGNASKMESKSLHHYIALPAGLPRRPETCWWCRYVLTPGWQAFWELTGRKARTKRRLEQACMRRKQQFNHMILNFKLIAVWISEIAVIVTIQVSV